MDNQQGHAPGPWTLKQERNWPFELVTEAADGTEVARRGMHAFSTADKTPAAANARDGNAEVIAAEVLRAAAPELLAALEGIIGMAANFLDQDLMTNPEKDPDIIRARAAIAKARAPLAS